MIGRRPSRPTLPQDVYRRFMWAKRIVRAKGDVTAVQAEIATEILAILYYRRLLTRPQARGLTPAGLEAVARLLDPETTLVSDAVGYGAVAQAQALLRLVPPQTLAHAG